MSEDLEQAEAAYAKAVKQIEEWGQHPDSSFARDQVELWAGIRDANAWCLPGGS